jgi:hypothetical protein
MYKIIVSGFQNNKKEALNTAISVYKRKPEQLIRTTFSGIDLNCMHPYAYYDTIGKIFHKPGWCDLFERILEIKEKEGSMIIVDFCSRFSHEPSQHASEYLKLGIPFILSSDYFEEYGSGIMEYIENKVKEKRGLAIIGETKKRCEHIPVSLKTIDFLIEEAKKDTKGVYLLKNFQ